MANYAYDKLFAKKEKLILASMSNDSKRQYLKYKSGNFESYEVSQIIADLKMLIGERGQRAYDISQDKQAFLRGLYADKCIDMLKQHVRDMAVATTVKDMRFKTIDRIHIRLWGCIATSRICCRG